MIDQILANQLAQEHVSSLSVPAIGYRIALGKIRRVEPGWYFDFRIICESDIPVSEQEKYAGAFGILVNHTNGEVTEVSHGDWVDLGLAFHDDPYGTD